MMITVYCRRSDAEFWRMTPREANTLVHEYNRMELVKRGIDPDKIEDKKKPMSGEAAAKLFMM